MRGIALIARRHVLKGIIMEEKTLMLFGHPMKISISDAIPENCILAFTVQKAYLFKWTGVGLKLIKEVESMYYQERGKF